MVLVALVSYLGNKEREKRLEIVKKTIKDYQSITPEFQVCVFAQGYEEDEVKQLKELNCLVEEFPPKSCSHARNVAIEFLMKNKNTYDWMLLSDDDTSIYNYYGVADFISQLSDVPEKVHYINFHQPQVSPFKEYLINHRDFFENNFCLRIDLSHTSMNPVLIRNTDNIQNFDENLKMIDDDNFYVHSTWNENKVYYCPTIITKNNAPMYSGVIDYEKIEVAREYIYNTFNKVYEGKFKLSDLVNKKIEKDVINIPRRKKYNFTNKELDLRTRAKKEFKGELF